MYYPQELIEEIRLQNDILDIVSEHVQLRRKGSSYFGLCPFHNERTPSFSVSPDKQIYYCFGCGAGGNVISFIMQIENYEFVEAIKYLAERANIALPEPEYSEEAKKRAQIKKSLLDIHRHSARYFFSNLHSNRGQACLTYLNNRNIAEKYQRAFGLGFSNYTRNDLYKYLLSKGYSENILDKSGLVIKEKNKEGYFDRFGNRLMFPIFDVHNNIIAFGGRIIGEGQPKYLNSAETVIFDKSKNLYGLNWARKTKREQIIIVEGYMDTIALHQAGFDNAVASLGTAFNIEHARLLRKYTQNVTLIYDSDEAGTNAALRAIPILVSSGLQVNVLQVKNAKDPDEYISKFGAEAFEKLLENAQSYIDFQISCVKKKYNLQNTEHKIKFTIEVSKLISKVDNAIEQDAYIKQIASVSGISEISIKHEIDRIKVKSDSIAVLKSNNISKYTKKITQDSQNLKGVVEAQRRLLNVMANNELVCQKVRKYLKSEKFLEPCFQKLAAKIYELYDSSNNVYPAELISYFENSEEQKAVTEVFAVTTDYSSTSELEKAINDQVKLILKNCIDIASRNSNDIDQIQQLIEDKRNLDKLNITLTDG